MEIVKELIWPAFITILIVIYRKPISSILESVTKRVEEGSSFKISASGLELGEIPQLPDSPAESEMIDDGFVAPEVPAPADEDEKDVSDPIALTHRSRFWKMKNGRAYYKFQVSIAATDKELTKINRVVYKLHKSFKNPNRSVNTKEDKFLLKSNCWGEFTVHADVHLEDGSIISLSRYIDLK